MREQWRRLVLLSAFCMRRAPDALSAPLLWHSTIAASLYIPSVHVLWVHCRRIALAHLLPKALPMGTIGECSSSLPSAWHMHEILALDRNFLPCFICVVYLEHKPRVGVGTCCCSGFREIGWFKCQVLDPTCVTSHGAQTAQRQPSFKTVPPLRPRTVRHAFLVSESSLGSISRGLLCRSFGRTPR